MTIQNSTYRAILQGSQLIWLDSPPDFPANIEVNVTITPSLSQIRSRGEVMAAALEKLAQRNTF